MFPPVQCPVEFKPHIKILKMSLLEIRIVVQKHFFWQNRMFHSANVKTNMIFAVNNLGNVTYTIKVTLNLA